MLYLTIYLRLVSLVHVNINFQLAKHQDNRRGYMIVVECSELHTFVLQKVNPSLIALILYSALRCHDE